MTNDKTNHNYSDSTFYCDNHNNNNDYYYYYR